MTTSPITTPPEHELPWHNVPTALSSFIGRAREVSDLKQALATARLITVVGAGGAGKTRIVREVAASVTLDRQSCGGSPFFRVIWVELAPVSRGSDVASTLAGLLDINPTSGKPIEEAIVEALRTSRTLLVLDNCEHVIHDAAHLAETLLRGAPGLTIAATSREPLAIEGELAWHMPGLARPEGDDRRLDATAAARFDAIRLFVERARAATPGFALTDANATAIGSICAKLDGLPLALELAAAVVPVLGIDGLLTRLSDALSILSRGRRTSLPRHRTLRAVLDWSYELLTEDERALLRRLSVFRGAFTLDDVAACATRTAPGVQPADIVPILGRLVEHSLIEVREEDGEANYRLLETVRQYGSALLRGLPEERDVRRRHAEWVAQTAEAAEPLMFSPARGRTVARLRKSVEEIRAALHWAAGPDGDTDLAIQIAGALGWFWISGLPWEEARALLQLVLDAADRQQVADVDRSLEERVALGRMMYPVIGLSYFAGDTATMLAVGAREIAIWDSVDAAPDLTAAQQLTAARGRALSNQLTGLAHAMRGERDAAVRDANRCIAVAERSHDAWLLAVMLMRRALVYYIVGNYEAAQIDFEASIRRLRAIGELWFLSLALEGLGVTMLARGNIARAGALAREGVVVLREERDPWFVSRSLDTIAMILLAQLDLPGRDQASLATAAARLMGTADGLRRRCGAAVIGTDVARHARTVSALRDRLGAAAWAMHFAAGQELTLEDAFRLMDDDPVVAALAHGEGAHEPTADTTPASPVAHQLHVQVLGTFALAHNGAAWSSDDLPSGKGLELFLYLLLHRGVTKEEAGLALWPDASAAQVRNLFHVTLHHLRRSLGAPRWIAFERNIYRLDRTPEPGHTLVSDVDLVLAASARARALLRERTEPGLDELRGVRRDLDQHGGAMAQGVVRSDWIVESEDQVRVAWADGMDAVAQLAIRAGHLDDAASALESLLAREPLRESAHRLYMQTLASRGEPGRALAHFDALTSLLQRELGARPAAETRALAATLRG